MKTEPMRPIRTEGEYDRAVSTLNGLVLRTGLSPGEQDYVDALTVFIERYDNEHYALGGEGLTPLEVLKHLLKANKMRAKDLGMVPGSKGLASDILNARRPMSKAVIAKLAARFSVEPGVFLDLPQGRSDQPLRGRRSKTTSQHTPP